MKRSVRGTFKKSYADFLLTKQGENRNLELKEKIKTFQNKSSLSKIGSLKSLERKLNEENNTSNFTPIDENPDKNANKSQSMPRKLQHIKSNFSTIVEKNLKNFNFYENTRSEAIEHFSDIGISTFKTPRDIINNISMISNNLIEQNSELENNIFLEQNQGKMDLYIKPFVEDIVSEGQRVVESIDHLLKEKKFDQENF